MQLTDDQLGGLFFLAWHTIVSIGLAVVFRKTERPIWKAFCPVINAIETCRLAGLSGWWVLCVFVPLVNLFLPLYVALRLAQRTGARLSIAVFVWLTGFTTAPLLVLGQSPALAETSDSEIAHNFESPPQVPDAGQASRVRMIVLSVAYVLGLLCFPGLMIIGAMGFAGATPEQVDRAGAVAALVVLIPISLLIALIGGWILHNKHRYTAASSLVLLPIANIVAVFSCLVWVFSS